MKILFVATNVPVPSNNGQAIRSISIIRALKSSNHEVSFISFVNKNPPKEFHVLCSYCHSIEFLEHELTSLSQRTDYVRRVCVLITLKPFSVERFRSKAMREKIRGMLQAEKYDVIICDGIYALINIPETMIPIALNCHNVEHVLLERYADLEENPLKKYYASIESRLLRIVERRSLQRSALAMVCSQVDLEYIHCLHPNFPVYIVPNVVDTDFISPAKRSYSDRRQPVLLFQGGMDWYPNRDAVEYFIRAILPRVREQWPRIRFVVAGRNPPSKFIEQFGSDPMVEFTGTVPDMRPYLSAANLVIVPLRLGGGTRLKILEACAAGKPVVSTSIGAEGLNLVAGKEIILADDPADFADSVVMMLKDTAFSDLIGSSSRAAVVKLYSHINLKNTLDDVFVDFRTQKAI